jgi:polyhydroxyalkanoate synthase
MTALSGRRREGWKSIEERRMAKQQETPEQDQQDVLQVLGEIAENTQRLMHGAAGRHCAVNGAASPDPLNLRSTILELTARIMADPASMLQAQW